MAPMAPMAQLARRVLRPTEAAALLRVSRSTLWRWAATDPTFPQPFKLGPRVTVWSVAEVERWLADRASGQTE